jgi:hypothetical protein
VIPVEKKEAVVEAVLHLIRALRDPVDARLQDDVLRGEIADLLQALIDLGRSVLAEAPGRMIDSVLGRRP